MVFAAAHGLSLAGASGGYCLAVVCGLLIWNLPLSQPGNGHFLDVYSLLFLPLFPVLCLHLLWAAHQSWLIQYNTSSAFRRNTQILAFCLEHLTQSLQLDSPSLSSLYFLSLLLLDFYLGSCGIKSSYVKIIHFSELVVWGISNSAMFPGKALLRILLKFDFKFYNYFLDATLLMANGWIHRNSLSPTPDLEMFLSKDQSWFRNQFCKSGNQNSGPCKLSSDN